MDGHSLAAGDVAHDGFAGDRIAALGAIDHHVIAALHLDGKVAWRFGTAWNQRRRRAGRLLRGFDLFGRRELAWRGVLQHLPRREFAVAEAGVEILDLAVAVLSGDAFELRLSDLSEVHPQ